MEQSPGPAGDLAEPSQLTERQPLEIRALDAQGAPRAFPNLTSITNPAAVASFLPSQAS
jgi:hypothetical protein